MLYSGFNTLPRSVVRRQTGFAAGITRTLSRLISPYRCNEMKRFLLITLLAGFAFAIATLNPALSTQASPRDGDVIVNLERRVERLEDLVGKLSLNLERMQIADKDAAVDYDYENGFSILRFYDLKPFAGKLTKCVVFKPSESFDAENDGPTCRLTVRRESDGKIMIIDNFKTLPGSKKRIDSLIEQETCTFPNDIHVLRHTALYD